MKDERRTVTITIRQCDQCPSCEQTWLRDVCTNEWKPKQFRCICGRGIVLGDANLIDIPEWCPRLEQVSKTSNESLDF